MPYDGVVIAFFKFPPFYNTKATSVKMNETALIDSDLDHYVEQTV